MSTSDIKLQPDPVIELYKKDVDIGLIRENLKLTVEERFRKHARMQRFVANLRKAGEQSRQPQPPPLTAKDGEAT